MPSVASTLADLGGCATWAELRKSHTKHALRTARRRGEVRRAARGRYVLASVGDQRQVAHARSAVLSHLSAAQHHGWKVKTPPKRAWVTVRRNRKVDKDMRAVAEVHWADLRPEEVEDGVTTPLRTVVDCARALPFDEALAVADSALRAGAVDSLQLRTAAAALKGHGSRQARRVAAQADARSANPLESVLRAIVLDIPDIVVMLQHVVAEPGAFAVVDLADPGLRLILEAEGYEYHGSRDDWRKDCRRYSEIVSVRWWVLRFTYDDVMHHPERVRQTILRWLAHCSVAA